MKVEILEDRAALDRRAAEIVAEALRARPALVACVATGMTPLGAYARLAEMRAGGALDAGAMRSVQLDEYVDPGRAGAGALGAWMDRAFLEPLGIAPERALRFDLSRPPEAACAAMDRALARLGGLDLAILGLGPNGHVGFNEPPCGPDAPTRPIDLSPESLASNAAYWPDGRVPARAVTLGTAALMAARRVLLLVSGPAKHAILRRCADRPPGPDAPASWLQGHPRCTLLADRPAWEGA